MSEDKKNNLVESKNTLIMSDEFENALNEAAEVRNNKISVCKERNKHNYSSFYDLMLASRTDIQSILSNKKKNRTDADNNLVKEFKKDTSQMYKQVCDLLVPEDLEDGEQTKIQKMVSKITTVLKMMNYIGHNEIEDEFNKAGIKLSYEKMDETEVFSQDHIKDEINRIFTTGTDIKKDMNQNNEDIKTNIYESSVPVDLQYDKSMNPTGIKSSDFCKLVNIKAKMLKADDPEQKEKIKEQAENIAGDYIFQNTRNEIINKKLIDISNYES